MNKKDKDLLIKDLSARVFYGVKFTFGNNIYTMKGIDLIVTDEGDWEYAVTAKGIVPIEIDFIKPYLRPMSSMTEEERGKYMDFIEWSYNDYDGITTTCIDKERLHEYLNFIYSHHLDDNNFIEKGLALEAPEDMYKTE